MENIKVGIVGLGSCASSIVQLISAAKNENNKMNGIYYQVIGGYKPSNIDIVCGFDVDENKVGLDVSEGIFAYPNMARKHFDVPNLDADIYPGPVLDGLNGGLEEVISVDPLTNSITEEEIINVLKSNEVEVVLCFLPTGATQSVEFYAKASAKAKIAFVNATPEMIVNNQEIRKLFEKNDTPLLGDDLRSHFGATALHTALIELMHNKGISVDNTYQLNFGGNMDFYNLTNPSRSVSKHNSKKKALSSAGIDSTDVSAGPNGYIKYLEDNKICYLRLEGTSILDSNISLEIKLEVEDSPNSAGVIINAIRIAKVAKEKGLSGAINDVLPMLFKSPLHGSTESESYKLFENFVNKYTK